MTPRNIRAYQSRGLLFPPSISGRVALYSGAHVARLELIASLQREGFTLAAIKRLIDTPEQLLRDRGRPAAPLPRRQLGHRPDRADPGGAHPQRCCPTCRRTSPRPAWPGGTATASWSATPCWSASAGCCPTQGVPLRLVSPAAARRRRRRPASWASVLRDHLEPSTWPTTRSHDDLAKVAVQLSATAFEIAFLAAASRDEPEPGPTSRPEPATGQSTSTMISTSTGDVQRQRRDADRAARVHARRRRTPCRAARWRR